MDAGAAPYRLEQPVSAKLRTGCPSADARHDVAKSVGRWIPAGFYAIHGEAGTSNIVLVADGVSAVIILRYVYTTSPQTVRRQEDEKAAALFKAQHKGYDWECLVCPTK